MAAELQNIPIFILEHKWSSDIESNVYSDVEDARDISLSNYRKIHAINTCYLYCTFNSNFFSAIIFIFLHQKSDYLFFYTLFLSILDIDVLE